MFLALYNPQKVSNASDNLFKEKVSLTYLDIMRKFTASDKTVRGCGDSNIDCCPTVIAFQGYITKSLSYAKELHH